jgi:hypothetical protein
MFVSLGLEATHKVTNLAVGDFAIERDKKVGRTQVAIVFGDFVFQDEMIPPSVPRKLVYDAVVLMEIVARVGQNQVGREPAFQVLKKLLYLDALIGKEAVAELQDGDMLGSGTLQEKGRAAAGFAFAIRAGAKNDPVEFQIAPGTQELENRAAAADLDVVGMSTEA